MALYDGFFNEVYDFIHELAGYINMRVYLKKDDKFEGRYDKTRTYAFELHKYISALQDDELYLPFECESDVLWDYLNRANEYFNQLTTMLDIMNKQRIINTVKDLLDEAETLSKSSQVDILLEVKEHLNHKRDILRGYE